LRLPVFAALRVGAAPEVFFAVLRLAADALAGFAATFFFAGFAADFAAGFAFARAGALTGLLAVLPVAPRALPAEDAGLVFAEVLAFLAGRFAAAM
jgi:hypothetical protein